VLKYHIWHQHDKICSVLQLCDTPVNIVSAACPVPSANFHWSLENYF
jgi:hypothetical protein